MDTALYDGDFKVDSTGYPIRISDLEETLQQVIIRLLVKKGSFIYDPELGSNLSNLKSSYISDGSLKQQALESIKQALKPLPNISVLDLKITLTDYYEKLRLDITLSISNQVTSLTIQI